MSQPDLFYDTEPLGLVASRINRDLHLAEVAGDDTLRLKLLREWQQLARHVGDGHFGHGAVKLCLEISAWVRQHGLADEA